MIFDYFALALGNLKHRGVRSWLTMLGIFIGIAAVVSLISLGQGLQAAVVGQFGALSVDTLTINNADTGFGPPGSTAVVPLQEHDLEIVENTRGVKLAVGRLIKFTTVEYNDVISYNYIGDVPEDREKRDFVYNSASVKVDEGQLLEEGDSGKVFLGSDFKDGDFGKEIRVGSRLKINGEQFEVVGFAKSTSSFTGNNVIFMLTDDMKRLLEINDEWSIIEAQVENKDEIEEVAMKIEDEFRQDRDLDLGEEDFSIQTPTQSLEGVNNILNIINLIVSGIAAISLFVGGLGIMNTMYTSVLERTKEIGVMKAIGAKNSDVLMIFLIEAGLLGLVGGVVGALMGLGLAMGVASIAGNAFGIDFGVRISYPLIFGAIAFSFFIGVGSGILPAMQASKLKPVEALRS